MRPNTLPAPSSSVPPAMPCTNRRRHMRNGCAPPRASILMSSGLGRLLYRRRVVARHQLAADLRPQRHLDHAVVHIAAHPCFAAQYHPLAAEDVAVDAAVDYRVRCLHRAFDHAVLADRERGFSPGAGAHAAGDAAVHVQAAGELDIALHAGTPADQRIDAAHSFLVPSIEHATFRALLAWVHGPDERTPIGRHALALGSDLDRDAIRLEIRRQCNRLIHAGGVTKIESQLVLAAGQRCQVGAGRAAIAGAIHGDAEFAADRLAGALQPAQAEAQREFQHARQRRDVKLLHPDEHRFLLAGLRQHAAIELDILLLVLDLRLQLADGTRQFRALAHFGHAAFLGRRQLYPGLALGLL